MLGLIKLARQVPAIQAEVTALRTALEAETARARAADEALQDARAAIDTLQRQQGTDERLHRAEELASSASARLSDLVPMIEDIDRRTGHDHMQALESRILRLEKRLDQQAEDMQRAVAGLVESVDGLKRSRETF